MAKVKIQGNASGTGVLTVTAPNTSTDRTITLPDTTGTLLDENSSVPAANLTGTVADARISTLTASKLTGALPAISGAALTGISGGLSEADHWRINAGFTPANPTDMTTNWERPDTGGGGGYVGTGMSEAAGVWTFPSTGQYLIDFHLMASSTADVRYIRALINTTTNNGSAWYVAADGRGSLNPESSYWYAGVRATFLFDVTNVSTHKVKFSAGGENNSLSINGDSNGNETYVTFLKLGET
jgi:hypothetical protein